MESTICTHRVDQTVALKPKPFRLKPAKEQGSADAAGERTDEGLGGGRDVIL
jgi:hypothetical protein